MASESELGSEEIQPPVIHRLKVLFQNDDFVVIHKPPGLHVHQPEMARRRVPREMTILWTLRQQIEKFLYPVHRLDVATEGVLVMAFEGKIAGALQKEFQGGSTRKTYHAIVRGWTDDDGRIELPLERDSNGSLADAVTNFRTLARVELPHAVGKRYPSARYSLVEARPETGRWHQLRRHLARTHHPIVGDREHGDSHHSRFFRETLGLPGLWLRAAELKFRYCEEDFTFTAPISERWLKAGAQLGFREAVLSDGFEPTHDDVNDFDCDGYRPIHHAILAGFTDGFPRAKVLMAAGALLNAPTESGDGALVLLCKALRDAEAVLWVDPLLAWGAEIIDRDTKGWSALHHAVSREMILTVKKLMEAGADPFLKAVDGSRPVDIVARLSIPRDDLRELLKTITLT